MSEVDEQRPIFKAHVAASAAVRRWSTVCATPGKVSALKLWRRARELPHQIVANHGGPNLALGFIRHSPNLRRSALHFLDSCTICQSRCARGRSPFSSSSLFLPGPTRKSCHRYCSTCSCTPPAASVGTVDPKLPAALGAVNDLMTRRAGDGRPIFVLNDNVLLRRTTPKCSRYAHVLELISLVLGDY